MALRRRVVAFLAVLAGVLTLYVALCAVLAWAYVHPTRTRETVVPSGFQAEVIPGPRYGVPAWARTPPGARAGVILVHGYGGDRAGWVPLAQRLERAGVAVVIPTMAAHGDSPARTVGFGPAEAREVASTVEWLRSRYPDSELRVVAVGVSLGGAAVWEAASRPDVRLDGVVTEGTFTELDSAVNRWFDRVAPGGSRWLAPVRWIATRLAGVDATTVRPVDRARSWVGRPCLVVHTALDQLVPASESAELARAAGCPVWTIPHSRHAHGARDATEEYARRILDLLPRG